MHADQIASLIIGIQDAEKRNQTIITLLKLLMASAELREVILSAVETYTEGKEELTSEIVKAGFEAVLESFKNAKPGLPGRRPEKVERIYALFKDHELDSIPLEFFMEEMPISVKNARQQVPRDISKTNAEFVKLNIPLEIKGFSKGREGRETFYRIILRSKR